MTHLDALDALADHPHLWRFRQLCADDNPDVEQREGYRALVVRMARGEATADTREARPVAAEALALTRAMNACPFRSRGPGCGCSGRCALRGGAIVSHLDCFPCIERYG